MTATADSQTPEPTFRDLFAAEAWGRLSATAERMEVAAGTVLVRRGERSANLYVVMEGSFEVVDTRSSPETVLSVLGPGHVLGDMSFVDRAPAAAEVRAHDHASALRWERDALLTQLDSEPDLALLFYRSLASTVVARSRKVLSAAVAGGFGAGGASRERFDALESDRIAEELAIELTDPLSEAGTVNAPHRAIELADALTGICRWFTVAGEDGRAAAVGARLRELLDAVLASSATTAAMLARQDGSPAGPTLFRHVLSGRPEGQDPAGALLDGALLELPTFRGWRWRDRTLADALADALPAQNARVLSVSLTGAPTSDAQLAMLRSRGGHITSVHLAPRPESGSPPPGITRTTVVADLPSLLRGSGPRVGEAHDAVLIDRVSDVVPDEVLRALLIWAQGQLRASGQLLVGHAIPADDVALLEHLLRWPSLPRRSASVVGLLPRGGQHTVLAPHDDEAAGLVLWRSQP